MGHETTIGKKSNSQIEEILVDNKPITDPKMIAQEFNGFFSTIGQKISDSITPVQREPETYINDYDINKPKFELGNVGPVHIADIVKSFDSKAIPDMDGLSLKILKYIINEISVPLSHVFNSVLTVAFSQPD